MKPSLQSVQLNEPHAILGNRCLSWANSITVVRRWQCASRELHVRLGVGGIEPQEHHTKGTIHIISHDSGAV
jgi:hypothetical protein